MKNLILTITISAFSLLSFAQKSLNQVRIKNPMLEEISASLISDSKAYQKERFKSSKSTIMDIGTKSSPNSKFYTLKGGDDLIKITAKTDKGLLESWERTLPTLMETFTPLLPGMSRYNETLTGKGYKATFFFVKDYKLNNWNHIVYKNTNSNITLYINYISNSPDSVKIENMRKIIQGMNFD